MYSVIIDNRGGFVQAPKNKITAKPALLDSLKNSNHSQVSQVYDRGNRWNNKTSQTT